MGITVCKNCYSSMDQNLSIHHNVKLTDISFLLDVCNRVAFL